MTRNELPLPPHFDPEKVGEVWKVPYQEHAEKAEKWARKNKILPAFNDAFRISLLLVDVQNTFCIPEFELFVGGRTGTGAGVSVRGRAGVEVGAGTEGGKSAQ